jgi:TolB-like protein
MQKVIIFLSLFLVALGMPTLKAQNLDKEIEAIVAPLVTAISAQTVKNVAIADFTSLDGTPSELGKYIAEEFSYHLVNAKKTFIVIDRSRVSGVLKENGLGTTGLVDPNTIAKLGKLKGIDAVIAGTMTPTGNTIRLIVKVWNLETQGLVAASRGDISITPMIGGLQEKLTAPPGSGTTTSPNNTKLPTAPPVAKFTKGHLTFELLSCSQINQSVECKVRVTSNGKDEDLRVYHTYYTGGGPSRIITSSGNEYIISDSKLADKTHSGDGEQEKSMVSNVPLNCVFTFTKVTEKVEFIPKLEISCLTYSFGNFQMELRNIPVK